jgi:hypothetical protein
MVLLASATAHALQISISAKALEHTLETQLFTGPNGRYYMRGSAGVPCSVYAENPVVSFAQDRVVVHVKTHARLGTSLRGACLGLGLNTEGDVSVVPDAQGESIGFRDARVEHLSESREVNFLLEPFLSRKLPQQMKVNAADLLRQLLSKSAETTGYNVRLDNLKIHSMQVSGDALVVDFDGGLSVQ